MKYKYSVKPTDKEYRRVVARASLQRKTRKAQIDRWYEVISYALSMLDGKTIVEIAEEITDTTDYKIIKRSKGRKPLD